MDDKVELKVNVINQLKLLRQSTFKDILCFLDEDIQNAQRAKAKEVRITTNINKKTIVIENDGKILTNPQSLFSIAESGWDEEVKSQENPFGMGFFSNITISNLIEVYSGKLHIVFDVDKMINTNNTEILVEEVEEPYNGFKLILNNINFDKIYSYQIEERVEMLGKYIQELDIYYNDELQEKKDLLEGDESTFQIQVKENNFRGWIALGSNYWFNDNLNIFHKGRLVCKLEDSAYLKGDIHIDDSALNLTSPDRKDIIRDQKYSDFKETIKRYAELLCEDSLLNGDEEDIQEYSNAIAYYINKNKVKNKLKFITFRSKKEKDIEYLKGIALAQKENKDINSFKGYLLYLNKDKNKQSESHVDEIEIQEEVITQVPEAKGRIVHEGSSSYSEGYIEKPEIKDNEVQEQNGELIINNEEPVFWLSFDEIEKYEYKLNIIKHYNLKIIIARNKVETEILKSMKNSNKVLHISELFEDIRLTGYLSNTELNKKEQRALMIFDLISRILGFDHNIFAIGDLMVTKTVEVKSLGIKNEIIEEKINVLRNSGQEKVYIDRSVVDLEELDENNNSKLTLKDYKFILSNICDLVEQSYLLIENTPKEDIMKDLLMTLGKGII
jgi:hypothetical protein